MTVRELIAELQQHDPDMEVATCDSGSYFYISPPEVRVMHTAGAKMAGGPWECSDPHYPCGLCQRQLPKEQVLLL